MENAEGSIEQTYTSLGLTRSQVRLVASVALDDKAFEEGSLASIILDDTVERFSSQTAENLQDAVRRRDANLLHLMKRKLLPENLTSTLTTLGDNIGTVPAKALRKNLNELKPDDLLNLGLRAHNRIALAMSSIVFQIVQNNWLAAQSRPVQAGKLDHIARNGAPTAGRGASSPDNG